MGQYTVQISDMDGNACNIRLSLPVFKQFSSSENSTWRVLDEGLLKYRSGGLKITGSAGGGFGKAQTGNLRMFVVEKYGAGVFLYDFLDEWSLANDSGSGFLAQPWAISMKPGAIGWVLV